MRTLLAFLATLVLGAACVSTEPSENTEDNLTDGHSGGVTETGRAAVAPTNSGGTLPPNKRDDDRGNLVVKSTRFKDSGMVGAGDRR